MTRMGMDVDLVEEAGKALQTQGQSINTIIANIDRTVGALASQWDGPDARRFISEWWPDHKRSLQAAGEHILGLGQSALNNASDQREVSSGSSSHTGRNVGEASVSAPDPAPDSTATGAGPASGGLPGSITPGLLPVGAGRDGYVAAVGNVSDQHADPWGAYSGNCTSWVAYRRHELGLSTNGGNGNEMAGNLGGTSSTPPSLGAVVSSGSENHVMIVEEIVSDNPTSFRVSEMNIKGDLGSLRTDTVWTKQADGSWLSSHGRREPTLVIAA